MSHIAPAGAEVPAAAGVAGAVFPPSGSGAGGGDFLGGGGGAGGGGADALGAVGEGVLPFTGSVFTAPIAMLGLLLTFGGWALLRLGLREE
jgi:hypothetical protein